ncbi:hypothetical protein BKA66DRAFT_588212 [Pyrenochaeta sp. MPI-SDFR-AT-0127]|nr:hypothetical protein BKA66DRAFT_588212 [Pyrenochaeta sp. MPI-SDFR-AT-0127]
MGGWREADERRWPGGEMQTAGRGWDWSRACCRLIDECDAMWTTGMLVTPPACATSERQVWCWLHGDAALAGLCCGGGVARSSGLGRNARSAGNGRRQWATARRRASLPLLACVAATSYGLPPSALTLDSVFLFSTILPRALLSLSTPGESHGDPWGLLPLLLLTGQSTASTTTMPTVESGVLGLDCSSYWHHILVQPAMYDGRSEAQAHIRRHGIPVGLASLPRMPPIRIPSTRGDRVSRMSLPSTPSSLVSDPRLRMTEAH